MLDQLFFVKLFSKEKENFAIRHAVDTNASYRSFGLSLDNSHENYEGGIRVVQALAAIIPLSTNVPLRTFHRPT